MSANINQPGQKLGDEGWAPRRAWGTLAMLSLLLIVSLLDRQILVLLIAPLKVQFALSDVHIGLLIGSAFAITYAVLGILAGRIADQGSRKNLIIAGATIWCLSTIAAGFATSFVALVAFRVGLAAGEAVLTPAAHSMISDLFPPEKRAAAASVFVAAAFVGGPLAYSGGALIISSMDRVIATAQLPIETWQATLFAVGLPGLLLVLLFSLVVREPVRKRDGRPDIGNSSKDVLAQLLSRRKLYFGLFIGAMLLSGASSAVIVWGVETFARDFGWTAVRAGAAFGPVVLIAGVAGSLLAPWIGTRLRARGRWDSVVIVSIGCSIVSLLALAVGLDQPNPLTRLVLVCVGLAGAVGACTNIASAMQEFAPAKFRGTFVGIIYLLMTLYGYGVAPVVVPWASEITGSAGESLTQGLMKFSCMTTAFGLLLFLWVRDAYGQEARAGFPTCHAEKGEPDAAARAG